MRVLRFLTLAALVASALARSQQIAISFDPQKSTIGFTLGDVLHTVHGTFHLKAGHVLVDPATGAISGEIVVDAASGNSGNATRDRRMNRNILETDRYPEIKFVPEKISGSVPAVGSSSVQVAGWFTIHGASHEIRIPLETQISGPDITADGKFVVPYVAWGMKNPSTFLLRVNDKVEIDLKAAGHINR
jgi:polyisoprenoid-binding protein YceI